MKHEFTQVSGAPKSLLLHATPKRPIWYDKSTLTQCPGELFCFGLFDCSGLVLNSDEGRVLSRRHGFSVPQEGKFSAPDHLGLRRTRRILIG